MMKIYRVLDTVRKVCTLFLFCLFELLLPSSLSAQNTVIKAGYLFNSRTGAFSQDQTIIVKEGKIVAVGKDLPYRRTDTLLDLSNAWVLPGLIDCHVHLTTNFPYRNLSIAQAYTTESSSLRALRGGYVAGQLLRGGFTTIKEIGNDANYASADVLKAINHGWLAGPDIVYAGKIIAPYGGQTSGVNREHEHLWDFEFLDADTPDEIKKAVRQNIYYGATVIKLVSGDNAYYNVEDIQAAVQEANKTGLKVTVHVMGGPAARNAIVGGAAAIEHGFDLDNELLRLMHKRGTFLVGTDFSFANWYAYGMDSTAAHLLEKRSIDRLQRAYKARVKMAFGTDIIVDLPGLNRLQTNLKELQTWKLANIPAAYTLQTMTLYAAELLGVSETKGVIAPAYWADIIALKSNPLTDITKVEQIKFVMKKGKIIRFD
jgi:imidazolonepropionase-like amidohydrolase